ncbi:MAG: alpha/beta hydrolase [Idiomarina sp.]|nr:alpha/beta hydrolase [Idiomarina sp.]
MSKQVGWSVLILAVCALTACSSLVERQMATHQGFRGALSLDVGQVKRELCVQGNRCTQVIDWGHPKAHESDELLDKLSLKMDVAINEHEFELNNTYQFESLADDAPIVLIFPGYGMRAEHMSMTAAHLRSLGLHPFVVASPTEQQPFNFGVQGARDLAVVFAEQYAGRDLYLLGFSLGSLAVTEFSLLHEPKGAILIAPLLEFNASAMQLIDMRRRNSRLARVIPQSSYAEGLSRLVERSEIDPAKLSWEYAAEHLPNNVLVMGSTFDSMSQYTELERITGAQGRDFSMFALTEPMHIHPTLALPLPEIESAISDWLSGQSQ